MRLATVSDIHGMWDKISYPEADTLVFAGDICGNYYMRSLERLDALQQLCELKRLNNHFENLLTKKTYKHIIVVGGNHDWCLQLQPTESRAILTAATYLEDSEITIDGVKFYGSPWTPNFWNWAFNFYDPGKNETIATTQTIETWDKIPLDTTVLITHGPPHGIRDIIMDGRHVGCPHLAKRIDTLTAIGKLKLHVFGHIHHSYGSSMKNKTLFLNTAICNEKYEPLNPVPTVVL